MAALIFFTIGGVLPIAAYDRLWQAMASHGPKMRGGYRNLPVMDPVLDKVVVRAGRTLQILINEKPHEYNEDFRLFLGPCRIICTESYLFVKAAFLLPSMIEG